MRKLYKIAQFLLDPEAHVLTYEGAAVALGARGVAVLTALVSRANEYVEKSAILDAAWPGLVVEENNLAVQISAIRRAFARVPGGEGWIETLARRGYRFVGPVAEIASRSGPAVVADRKRTNLPELLTSFVGRERELAEIKQLLPRTRLLTLTGTGGIGKTRLAQQAAAEVLDAYRDGVWFVDLAPLTDPVLMPSALAQVLQVKESAGQSLVSALCNHLREREALLILDNCEQVLDACARLTEALLRETAHVSVIATSRKPLHLTGERAYPLGALPLPNLKAGAQSIARSDAVQLFVERARQYRPRFDLQEQRARAVAEICVRLDGIPLALELAAARVAVLPVEQIARLLDQRFRLLTSGDRELPRHQTLRAMIDWSYELLDDAEKALFARLSVFAGGWTLAAAEAVCGGEPIAKDEVVYVLIGLIEQSLVVADEDGDRYHLLETVREYAKDRLVASGNADAVRQGHRDYFLALAEEAEPKLMGAEQGEWLRRLEEEHENLRAALTLSPPGSGLQLAGALWRFWYLRGYLGEGRTWISRMLAAAPTELEASTRAKALHGAGALAWQQGDYPAARELCEVSLALRRDLGDQLGISMSLNTLGLVAYQQCDYASARALHQESLQIRRELGDRHGIAQSLHNLGLVAFDEGDYPSARALHEASRAGFRELGNRVGIAQSLSSQGDVAFNQCDYVSARALYEESLAIQRELGDRWGNSISLNNLANVALQEGDHPSARRMHGESLTLRRELGDRQGIAQSLHSLANVAREQGDYSSAQALYKESLAIKQELGDRWGIAGSLEGLAYIASASAGPARAARIWGGAERLREEIGSALPPIDRPGHDLQVAAARSALGDDVAFDRAWQAGRALTLEQAIADALEEQVERP